MSTYAWGADEARPFTRRDRGRGISHRRYATAMAESDQGGGDRRSRRRGRGRGPWEPPADGRPGAWSDDWLAGGPRGRRGSRGPRGGRRGRANRGDVRLAILALLAEGPRHGYQVILDITERSEGAWRPSPGAVYPALSALQDEGLVDDEKIDGRRVFALTDAGREEAARRADDLARVLVDNAPGPEHYELADLRELVRSVGVAAMSVLGSGTVDQREKARQALERARRDLYRILADDVTDADAPAATT